MSHDPMNSRPTPSTGPDEAWYGRMEMKMDMALVQMRDHETRLRSLERFRNWAKGVAAAITAGGVSLGTLFKIKGT